MSAQRREECWMRIGQILASSGAQGRRCSPAATEGGGSSRTRASARGDGMQLPSGRAARRWGGARRSWETPTARARLAHGSNGNMSGVSTAGSWGPLAKRMAIEIF
eukprot:5980928-Pyramimonas_sp.AAC.1